jgi:hypothetical protein
VLKAAPLLVLVGKLVVDEVATNEGSYRIVNNVRWAIVAAFWRARGRFVRCPKLLKILLCCTGPGIFVASAALAIAFVVWIENYSGVLYNRLVKLGVVFIELCPFCSKICRKVIFGRAGCLVIDVLKRFDMRLVLSKEVLEHWYNLVNSTNPAGFPSSLKSQRGLFERAEHRNILSYHLPVVSCKTV